MLRRALVFTFLGLAPLFSLGQQTLVYSEPHASFDKALELYDARKYSAAMHLFEQVSASLPQ